MGSNIRSREVIDQSCVLYVRSDTDLYHNMDHCIFGNTHNMGARPLTSPGLHNFGILHDLDVIGKTIRKCGKEN